MSNPVSPTSGLQGSHNTSKIKESINLNKVEDTSKDLVLPINLVSEQTLIKASKRSSITRRRSGSHSEQSISDSDETINDHFIQQYNENIGSEALNEKALRLLYKMQRLGGLIKNPKRVTSERIDINTARRGLAVLAGIKNNDELKIAAIDSLYTLIKADRLTKESAKGLVSVILALNNHMDNKNLQVESPEAQIALAKVYGAVAKLILYYQSDNNTNAITSELKNALSETVINLRKLNSINSVELSYYLEYALEGISRLKDDTNYLTMILKSLFHLTMAAASKECQTDLAKELELAFSGIKIHKKSAWYDSTLALTILSKKAIKDIDLLIAMQEHMEKNMHKLDWRYLYSCLKLLTSIVLNGTDASIRRKALEGWHTPSLNYPGVISFLNLEYAKKLDFTRYTNFGVPAFTSATNIIQSKCLKQLNKIAKLSQDPKILQLLADFKPIIEAKKKALKVPELTNHALIGPTNSFNDPINPFIRPINEESESFETASLPAKRVKNRSEKSKLSSSLGILPKSSSSQPPAKGLIMPNYKKLEAIKEEESLQTGASFKNKKPVQRIFAQELSSKKSGQDSFKKNLDDLEQNM